MCSVITKMYLKKIYIEGLGDLKNKRFGSLPKDYNGRKIPALISEKPIHLHPPPFRFTQTQIQTQNIDEVFYNNY